MRSRLYVLIFLGLGCASLVCAQSLAQAPPSNGQTRQQDEDRQPSGPAADSPIRETGPKLFYLRNEKGVLVYVPDFSFERWERLVRIARNLSDPERPAFVIQEMTAQGDVRADRVDLDVVFTIQHRPSEDANDDSWVRVPLRLNEAILREPPQFEGPEVGSPEVGSPEVGSPEVGSPESGSPESGSPESGAPGVEKRGEPFLTFDEDQDGYECWIQSAADTTHTIRLSISVPLETVAGESHFRINVPTTLASQITFHVPEDSAEGTIENVVDNTSRSLAFEKIADGQGEFSTRGIRGNVTLRWHKSRVGNGTSSTRLDIFGSITVTANELSQEVRSDGRFVVRGFGGPVESFRVRLPPGMRFRESPEPGYQVEPVAAEPGKQHEGQLVDIRLDQPAVHEAHIQLVAELPSDLDDPNWPTTVSKLVDHPIQLQPARFDFLGAVRHRGRIDFVVKGDWSLQWDEDPNVPRVELGGLGSFDREIASRFRYFSQPSNLKIAIRQKATRISVEPTYGLLVDSQRVRLRASLACRSSGSKAGPLALRLRGWTIESLSFADVPNSLPEDLTVVDPLVIAIPSEAQASGRFTVEVVARRDLTAGVVSGTDPLRVVLPQVEAANPSRTNLIVSPASITVTAAQNVALTPRPREMQALAPLVEPSGTLDNATQANTFRYRDRGAVESASFVSDFKIQPRSVSVSVTSQAELDPRHLQVEQWFSYTILHEGVDAVILSVPKMLIHEGRVNLRILLDDQPLKLTVQQPSAKERCPVSVQLPQKILGNVELRLVHSPLATPELATEKGAATTIPLVFPATNFNTSTSIIGNKLTVNYAPSLQVNLPDGPWTVDQSNSEPGRMVSTTASDGADAQLTVSRRAPKQIESTLVRQTWIQTWIAGSGRRDRAVFRVRTSQPQLTVAMPQGTATDVSQIKLAVDHREITQKHLDSSGKITFQLPVTHPGGPEEHVIEVWYTVSQDTGRNGHIRLEAAVMEVADRAERCYWQLVLPRNEMLICGDQRMTMERSWRWQVFGWWREPPHEQLDLEDWIGASHQAAVPRLTNRYLFTSFKTSGRMDVMIGSRSMVFLFASAVALLAGLLLIYLPLLRHPILLVLAGVSLLATGIAYPDIAIMVGQAATLGLALGLAALLLRRAVWRNGTSERARSRGPQSDSKMADVGYPRSDGSSRKTTVSRSLPSHISSPGSKP